MSLTMYDAVEVDQIPPSPEAVAGYVGGKFPTYVELVKRFPHCHKLSIAVNSHEDAECLDIETGDAVATDAPVWLRRQKQRGVAMPVLYTSLSNVQTLQAVLQNAGIARKEYRLWVAHYTGVPHFENGSDATQYTDRAFGRNLDASLVTNTFFGVPITGYVPADEIRWEREFDELRRRNSAWAKLRRRVLIRTMVHRERLIVELANSVHASGGWGTANRKHRYEKLFIRTGKR